jgi:Zn-finger nucleic acid-binding protein
MNCKQCGAPMKVEEEKEFFLCEYCGCYDFPNPNKDGVALLDEISPYNCAACNKLLVTATIEDIHIFSCPICHGNLISQSKMLPILRQALSFNITDKDLSLPSNRSELQRKYICPVCQKKMDAYPYGGGGNINIQGCRQCELIWLDFGELTRIIRSFSQMYQQTTDEPGQKIQSVKL